jgi:hypothetical protein
MIFFATPGNTAGPAILGQGMRQSVTVEIYEVPPTNEPPENALISLESFDGELTVNETPVPELSQEFDWSNPKVEREFIRLEQKKLAKQANPEEVKRYQCMKCDRNANIFADRNVRDYAEVQRLKKLAEKLAEIQKYMRPFRF